MFGIPEWAIGVAVIIFAIPAAIVLLRLVHPLLPPSPSRARGGEAVDQGQVLDDVQARLADLDQLKERVTELEERVDFAERVLSERREAPRLGPSKK